MLDALKGFKEIKGRVGKYLHFYYCENSRKDGKPLLMLDHSKIGSDQQKVLTADGKLADGRAGEIGVDKQNRIDIVLRGNKTKNFVKTVAKQATKAAIDYQAIIINGHVEQEDAPASAPPTGNTPAQPHAYGTPPTEEDAEDTRRPAHAYAQPDEDDDVTDAKARPAHAYAQPDEDDDVSDAKVRPAHAYAQPDEADPGAESSYANTEALNPQTVPTAPLAPPQQVQPQAVPKRSSRDPLRQDEEMAVILDRKERAEDKLAKLLSGRPSAGALKDALDDLDDIRDEMEAAQKRMNAAGFSAKSIGKEYEGEDKRFGWRAKIFTPKAKAIQPAPAENTLNDIKNVLEKQRKKLADAKFRASRQGQDSTQIDKLTAMVEQLQSKQKEATDRQEEIRNKIFDCIRTEQPDPAVLVPFLQELQANSLELQKVCGDLIGQLDQVGIDPGTPSLEPGPQLDEAALLAQVPGLIAEQKDLFARNAQLEQSDRRLTQYFGNRERKHAELEIDKHGTVRNRKGKKVDSEGKGPSGALDELEYVVDARTGKLYQFYQTCTNTSEKFLHPVIGTEVDKDVAIHHSSVLAGGDVAGAGGMAIDRGRIVRITNSSGHYKPGATQLLQTVEMLLQKGALIDEEYAMLDPVTKKGIPLSPEAKKLHSASLKVKKRLKPFIRLARQTSEVIREKEGKKENCDKEIDFLEELHAELAGELAAVAQAELALQKLGAGPASRFLFAEDQAEVGFSEIKQGMTGLQIKGLQTTTSSIKDFLTTGAGNQKQADNKRAFMAELQEALSQAVEPDSLHPLEAMLQEQKAHRARLEEEAKNLEPAQKQEAETLLKALKDEEIKMQKALLLRRTALNKVEMDFEAEVRATDPAALADLADKLANEMNELKPDQAAKKQVLAKRIEAIEHVQQLQHPETEKLIRWQVSLQAKLTSLRESYQGKGLGAHESDPEWVALSSRLAMVEKALGLQNAKEADLVVLAQHLKNISNKLDDKKAQTTRYWVFVVNPDNQRRAQELNITVQQLYENETGLKAPVV